MALLWVRTCGSWPQFARKVPRNGWWMNDRHKLIRWLRSFTGCKLVAASRIQYDPSTILIYPCHYPPWWEPWFVSQAAFVGHILIPQVQIMVAPSDILLWTVAIASFGPDALKKLSLTKRMTSTSPAILVVDHLRFSEFLVAFVSTELGRRVRERGLTLRHPLVLGLHSRFPQRSHHFPSTSHQVTINHQQWTAIRSHQWTNHKL